MSVGTCCFPLNAHRTCGIILFLLLGEGNVPWMVNQLIRKAEPDPAKQPMVVIGGR